MASLVRKCPCKNVISFSSQRVTSKVTNHGGRTLLARQCASQAQAQESLQDSQLPPTSSLPPKQIVIPRKVKRDDLSVLQALESTVPRNPKVQHYMMIDDPYLQARTVQMKKVFVFSKVAGKRAAQYVAKKYPYLFDVSPMNPWLKMDSVLKAFSQRAVRKYPIKTLKGLQERIRQRLPENAYASYLAVLEEKAEQIPEETVLDLLDLLCVYNSAETPETQASVEERFLLPGERLPYLFNKKADLTWNHKGGAEKLFRSMESPPPRAYNSYLRGVAKYQDTDAAYKIYNEMVEKKMPIDRGSYSAMLYIVSLLKLKSNWQFVLEILQHIKDSGVQPDVHTFNAALKSNLTELKDRFGNSMRILNEMKALNIEPTASTWLYIMKPMDRQQDHAMRHKILDHLQGKEFVLKHEDDMLFFKELMVTSKKASDLEMADKIEALLDTGRNVDLLGVNQNASVYYNNYFDLMLIVENIDRMAEVLEKVVPYTFSFGKDMLIRMLGVLERNVNYAFMWQLWEEFQDMVCGERDIMLMFLTILSNSPKEEIVSGGFTKIVDFMIDKFLKDEEEAKEYPDSLRRRMQLHGGIVGHMVDVYLNADQSEKAWEAFELYFSRRKKMPRFPSETVLVRLSEHAISEDNLEGLKKTLRILYDIGSSTDDVLKKAQEDMVLSEEQIEQLLQYK